MPGTLLYSAGFVLACCCLVAARPAVSASETVPTLASFEWLRGRFPGATSDEQARWKSLKLDAQTRAERRTAEVRQQLHDLGVTPVGLATGAFGDEIASIVLSADTAANDFDTWQNFEAAVHEARPYFEGFRYATVLGENIANRAKAPLGERLQNATIGEQVIRMGFGWGQGQASTAPALSAGGRRAMAFLLVPEAQQRDNANTEMLKEEVTARGWPLISAVGTQGSAAAWLLVQHADDDPAFQLRALRLMEPLLEKGEVSKRNYAYLYDRVMLPLTGKQRFGTQFTCIAARRVPQALEDPEKLDQLRAGNELEPIADYTATMERVFGKTCS